jgi:hypothetical protein
MICKLYDGRFLGAYLPIYYDISDRRFANPAEEYAQVVADRNQAEKNVKTLNAIRMKWWTLFVTSGLIFQKANALKEYNKANNAMNAMQAHYEDLQRGEREIRAYLDVAAAQERADVIIRRVLAPSGGDEYQPSGADLPPAVPYAPVTSPVMAFALPAAGIAALGLFL